MADYETSIELKWQLLVADAWADPELKQRLLREPQAVLAERGITAPAGKQLQIIEETEECIPLVLPAQRESQLCDAELESVAGGQWMPPPPFWPRPWPPRPFWPPPGPPMPPPWGGPWGPWGPRRPW